MRRHLTLILFVLALAASGMVPEATAQVGNCSFIPTERYLTVNNVRARILNHGGLFWSGAPHVYEVPKGGGVHSLFASGLWLGGQVGGTLRVAGSTYGPHEFWPGPADAVAAGQNCEAYNRIYRISKADYDALDNGQSPSQDVLDWPWELGAPVVDGDGNPANYNLAGGDRPELLGDESLFWIMNDVGGSHVRTGTSPLGVEVHVTAFSAASSDTDVDNATFYRYRVFNRNALTINDMYMGMFSDPDLGNSADDYVGSRPDLNLAYAYNADNDDELNYGSAPPAVGYQVLGGPVADADGLDNDNDSVIDEPGEQINQVSFVYYTNGGGVTGDPANGQDMYNYLQGRWKDGSPIQEGLTGYQSGGSPTQHMYTGTPPAFWSELNIDGDGTANAPGDRRFVLGVGAFDLAPGESADILVGILWARGSDNLDSVNELFGVATRLKGSGAGDIQGDQSSALGDTPLLVSPANGAQGQPLDLTLSWQWNGDPQAQFEIQLDETGLFDNPQVAFSSTNQLDAAQYLAPNVSYFWRVRALNAYVYSEWSSTRMFSTGAELQGELDPFVDFVVASNAGGALSPPEGAGADWQGFPGTGRPTGSQQQGDGHWLIHTFETSTATASYADFRSRVIRRGIDRVIPYDFEIRFDGGSDNYGWFLWSSGELEPIPFSIWRSQAGTSADPSDDVRLIPIILDIDATHTFNLVAQDHSVSSADNDPFTDGIYFYAPIDETAGDQGYQGFVAGAQGDPAAFDVGDEYLGRISLVNWNGSIGASTSEGIFNQVMPETGTVFRLEGAGLTTPSPVPSTPVAGDIVPPGSVSFDWASATEGSDRVLIATDVNMTNLVHDVSNAGPILDLSLTEGAYYWQVVSAAGPAFEPVRFEVASATQISYAFDAGWNLLGFPFSTEGMTVDNIFDFGLGNEGSVAEFSGRYQAPENNFVRFDRGYWAYFPSTFSTDYNAFRRTAFDVFVEPGWNLIAGPDCALPVSAVAGDVGSLAPGTWYAYEAGSYQIPVTLDSGRGYWVRADAAADLVLDCALGKGGGGNSDLDLLESFAVIGMQADDQISQRLYLGGVLPSDISDNAFTVPPAAPGNTWQGAFGNGRIASTNMSETINLDGIEGILVISNESEIHSEAVVRVLVEDPNGRVVAESLLSYGEQLAVQDASLSIARVEVVSGLATGIDEAEVPSEFTLEQNYPNPFNPSTHLRFALPSPDIVSISVIDVTGREVARVLDSASMSAGWHSVQFNASDLASGLYIYQVRSSHGVLSDTMVLIK